MNIPLESTAAIKYGRRAPGVERWTKLYFVVDFDRLTRYDFVRLFFEHVEALEPGGRRHFSGAYHGIPRYNAPSGNEYLYRGWTRPMLDGYGPESI